MLLNVIGGYIYPQPLGSVEGSETVEVTVEEHNDVVEGWSAEKPVVYKNGGGSVELTAELRSDLLAAASKEPAMVALVKRASKLEAAKVKSKASRLKGIGRKKKGTSATG